MGWLYLAAHAKSPKPDELFNVRDFHNSETYATHFHPLEIDIVSDFLGIFLPEGVIAQNSNYLLFRVEYEHINRAQIFGSGFTVSCLN